MGFCCWEENMAESHNYFLPAPCSGIPARIFTDFRNLGSSKVRKKPKIPSNRGSSEIPKPRNLFRRCGSSECPKNAKSIGTWGNPKFRKTKFVSRESSEISKNAENLSELGEVPNFNKPQKLAKFRKTQKTYLNLGISEVPIAEKSLGR